MARQFIPLRIPTVNQAAMDVKTRPSGSTVFAIVCFTRFLFALHEGDDDILVSLPSCTGGMKTYIKGDGQALGKQSC